MASRHFGATGTNIPRRRLKPTALPHHHRAAASLLLMDSTGPAAATTVAEPPPPPQLHGPLLVAELTALLTEAGLDLVHPFSTCQYDVTASRQGLETFGRDEAAALVVGNSNALWPTFIHALRRSPELAEEENPLDTYVRRAVVRSLDRVLGAGCQAAPAPLSNDADGEGHAVPLPAIRCDVRYADDVGDRFVNLLHAAEASGLAYLNRDIHLCVHPRLGPWFALRAVVTLDMDGGPFRSDSAAEGRLPNPFPELDSTVRAEVEAMRADGAFSDFRGHWRRWAGVRRLAGSAVDLSHCYGEHQLVYHYTKSKKVLAAAVNEEAVPAPTAPAAVGGEE